MDLPRRATWAEERRRTLLPGGRGRTQLSGAVRLFLDLTINRNRSSLESSDCGRSPLLLALIGSDGNATDDSGIDSICCDSAVSPSGGKTLSILSGLKRQRF